MTWSTLLSVLEVPGRILEPPLDLKVAKFMEANPGNQKIFL